MVIKTAIVHNIITPYRTVLFDAIAEHPDIELHVFYCGRKHQKRNWSIKDPNHDYTILPGVSYDKSDIHYHINPTVAYHLLRDDFDAAIIGGSTNFTMQLGYLISKIFQEGTILWTERWEAPDSVPGQILFTLAKQMVKQADQVIVPTEKARQFQETQGLRREQIVIAPNVVDPSLYNQHQNKTGDFRLLFIGQLIDRKGVHHLLDAYKQLEDADLFIVGDGPEREKYERIAENQGIDVTFTGWVSEREKRQHLAKADCFVLPSEKDLAPLVLNEAMAAGLPVVTTEGVGNAPEMILDGGNGKIVPAGDSSALAEALSELLVNHEDLNRMGKRSRRIIDERFSPQFAATRFKDAIEGAIK